MDIIGYIIYGLSILITLGWCLKIRHKAKYEQTREKSMELQGFLMTVSIILVLIIQLTPFHLLWLLPASFIIGLLSITSPLRVLWIFSSIYFLFWYIGIRSVGRKFYVDGEYKKAVTAFKDEITKKPKSAETYFNLALAYGKLKQHDNEISAYHSAIKLMPNKPETYFNLGNAYFEKGEKQKAIESFKHAISLRPDYLKAHYTICKTYAIIGDKENALKELEIVRKTDRRSADELETMIKLG
jgi:tetratricopeptide (TPR) repeat protein